MSLESEENIVFSTLVDVNQKVKENVGNCEKSSDSGVDTSDSCSTTFLSLTKDIAQDTEPLENTNSCDDENAVETTSNLGTSPTLSSSTSITPDLHEHTTGNLFDLDEISEEKSSISSTDESNIKTRHNLSINNKSPDKIANEVCEDVKQHMTVLNNDLQGQNSKGILNNQMTPDFRPEKFNLLVESSEKNIRTSTVSLDEEQNMDIKNTTISKTPYSRSAENISIHNERISDNLKAGDKETILNEFANQKTKAAATLKITPDIRKNIPEPLQNLDLRHARLPKELLSQDLGSIVKNVHGIFSSVSGSLKYAYNQTQKVPKTQNKIVQKPIPNGKVMDDIFEDEPEKPLVTVAQNDLDKLPMKMSIPDTDMKKEQILNAEGKPTEDDCKKDIFKLQIESLEKLLADQRKENAVLRERVKQQVDDLQERDQTFKELEIKVDMMSKRVEQAEREKDAAVMRYASVECGAIEAKRAAERASQAEKAALSEMELLHSKLRSAHSEKARICQLYDDKCHELSGVERELAKVREDVKELEGRLKWTQSKLRMEMDAYKESAERAEKLTQQVTELEAAKETAVANASDSARAKQLEQDLNESQAALILCRHEKEDLERRLATCTQQLDSCKRERDAANSSLTAATAEVERLKVCNLRLEEEAAELAALRAQAALADTLSAQLHRETERATQAEQALSLERARAETCARREAAALAHAARLTAQHVHDSHATSQHESKAQALAVDNAALRERISALEEDNKRLQTSLNEEIERRNRETRALARKVAEITEEAAEANKKLEWEKGENGVLKKKHANAIKELNRELQRALKRCEQLEAKLPPPETASVRTGSVSSLSSTESVPTHAEDNTGHNGHTDSLPDIQVREPDRQALIERIVSLQRALARRAERCEFLEEHSRQLTSELRGKSRLLRHLLCNTPAQALASSDSDNHKKEIARLGGGAMAAIWGGDTSGMTLELSIEMNSKLQAVLEDALLKNITLKENLDTLGEEIARLKEQKNTTEKKT